MRQLSYVAGRLILVVCAVLASTACSTGGTAPRAREAVVRVDEKDFRIVLPRKHVAAGNVRLELKNAGPVAHELIVVRGLRHLPLRSDGLTIDEDALPGSTVIEAVPPGHVEKIRVKLAPGRYQLFCNMAGHYLAGMHAELVVG
jgi:Sulfocyanin (SoxE) domain